MSTPLKSNQVLTCDISPVGATVRELEKEKTFKNELNKNRQNQFSVSSNSL